MTCIVGIEHEGRVYMGSDSMAANARTLRYAECRCVCHGYQAKSLPCSFNDGAQCCCVENCTCDRCVAYAKRVEAKR